MVFDILLLASRINAQQDSGKTGGAWSSMDWNFPPKTRKE